MKYLLTITTAILLLPVLILAQEEPLTIVPETYFADQPENVMFDNWPAAKSKYRWQWLETPKDDLNVYRYFTNENKLTVINKLKEGFSWTQASLSDKPLPAFWYYEATIMYVQGNSTDDKSGLLLKSWSRGEEIKILFLVNHINQTYGLWQINSTTNVWTMLHQQKGSLKNNFDAAIHKYDNSAGYSINQLKINRNGNSFLLHINNVLVETVKVNEPASVLNKLYGIGIAGSANQGYAVNQIKFAVFDTEALTVTEKKPVKDKPVNNGGGNPQKNNNNEQPEYGKYSKDNVYKEEEKLLQYINYTDSQLNPYLDKILRSGKDAWILYKTREKAKSLVTDQIDAIQNFLKEYSRYTSPTFKASIEARLAQAIGVRSSI